MRVLFFTLLCFQLCLAQGGQPVAVKGTKSSLVPPVGFTEAIGFSGFLDDEGTSSIMVTEFQASYTKITDSFTAEAFKKKGMTLLSKESIDFQGPKATWIEASQSAQGIEFSKMMLIFSTDSHVVMVTGIYPQSEQETLKGPIKEALLTTTYHSAHDDDPLAAAPFTVDVAGTGFKPVKYIAGNLIYSTDTTLNSSKPKLLIGNSIEKINSDDTRAYALNCFKNLPNNAETPVKEVNSLTLNGLEGYEIIGYNMHRGKELIYMVMLFNNTDDYILIIGQSGENMEEYITTFRRITKTFKIK